MTTRHPAIESLLGFFAYDHLPPFLADASKPFHDLAHQLADHVRDDGGPETAVALRKLLEGKDAAVRAVLTADRAADEAALADDPTPAREVEVAKSSFSDALLARLGLDPHEVMVDGFRVELNGDQATVTYRGVKRLPAAEVASLMADHGVHGEAGE